MDILFCTTEYKILKIKPHLFRGFNLAVSVLRFNCRIGIPTFFHNYRYENNQTNKKQPTLNCNQTLNNKSHEFLCDIIIFVRNYMVRFNHCYPNSVDISGAIFTLISTTFLMCSYLILKVNRAPSIVTMFGLL